ncbi:MAG TPA: hypothetical protein ENN63_09165 [Bacteroidetes bacterium]|nr:hypothetical protein [Bacteroidota bacterium]
MKKLILLIVAAGLFIQTTAQQTVVRQNQGTAAVYGGATPLIDAYEEAQPGDTLYLSGGSFAAPNLIDKQLVIFGAGFHPDSTQATSPTSISNTSFLVGENADNLHLEGLEFQCIEKYYPVQVDNLAIVRCRITGNPSIDMGKNGTASVVSNNLLIMHCVVEGYVDMEGVSGSLITGSIFGNRLDRSINNTLINNIFLLNSGSYGVFRYAENNLFRNNIFHNTASYIATSSSGNIFERNVFTTETVQLGDPVTALDNYLNVDLSTVYVNQSGYVFDFAHDYHLMPEAAAMYLGHDGSEVGIYGGSFPFREGAVPQNPHIIRANIAPSTDENGMLQVNITVGAQQPEE